MSKLKIKELSLYSFLVLIIGLLLSSGIIFVSLNKTEKLNNQLSILVNLQNSFLELKLNTERLLSTPHLSETKTKWQKTILKFEQDKELLTFINKKEIDELWYISKQEINEINNILKNSLLSPQNLNQKSILALKGELFSSSEKNKQFILISTLVRKLEFLLQYEDLIFNEFKKINKSEKLNIDEQLHKTIYLTLFLLISILVIIVFIINILNKKIRKNELELLNTQRNLSKKIDEIKDAKLLLQNIIDSIPASIFWKDTNNKFLGVNRNILKDANLKNSHEMIGKTDLDMPWSKEEAKQYMKDDKAVMVSGKAKLFYEETLTTKDGDLKYVITSKVPLKNIKNKTIGILGIYIDITEKKKLEDALMKKNRLLTQQSKMAALGEMLENIAHQWRQPLSLILSTTTGIKLKKEYKQLDDDFLLESIENINTSIKHLNQTIDDFRNYFKPDKKLDFYNIEDTIEQVLLLTKYKIKNLSINIIKEIQTANFFGLKNEFIQVLTNIFNNSVDALNNQEIEKKFIFIKVQKDITLEEKEENKFIKIEIYDNAGGISNSFISKVFDSYFTTKGEEGTGIGLYMSKEMIEEHMHGFIKVENENFTYEKQEYIGAKFTILIPQEDYSNIN